MPFTRPPGTGGPGGGVSVHNQLSGLSADDHPQYLTTERGDARYVESSQYATDQETLSQQISQKQPAGSYATSAEVAALADAVGSALTQADLDAHASAEASFRQIAIDDAVNPLSQAIEEKADSDDPRFTNTYANAVAGQIFLIRKSGGTWPNRPSTRTDIFFEWEGPAPMPSLVTAPAVNGAYNGDRLTTTAS